MKLAGRVPWQIMNVRFVASIAVGSPLVLGGLSLRLDDIPVLIEIPAWILMLIAGALMGLAAIFAIDQSSLPRAVAVFALIQAPHFAGCLLEALRHPSYMFVRPPPEFLSLSGSLWATVALSDFAELYLIARAWRAKCAASHNASDGFLVLAGVWLVGTALLRWPPFVAASEIDGLIRGLHVRIVPIRVVVQVSIGIAAVIFGHHRKRVRTYWLDAVAQGKIEKFAIVDAKEVQDGSSAPVLSREGPPRVLVCLEDRPGSSATVRAIVARLGRADS